MNILMIEDDRELCSAVSFRLEQEKASLSLSAMTGKKAFIICRKHPMTL